MLNPTHSPIPADQSRYSLVIAVAKRARQISEEAESKGTILVEKPVDLAVEDFVNHRFKIVEPKENDEPQS